MSIRDQTVPTFLIPQDIPFNISATSSDAQVYDQGFTYNQAGKTYNQAGMTYGGVYNVGEDIIPEISQASDPIPSMTVQNTQAQLKDQGYTYNQAGFTYNQVGVTYGGVYNAAQDIVPELSLAQKEPITITNFFDLYTTNNPTPPPTNSGMLIGILGLTYP